jgi:hypothetical protein
MSFDTKIKDLILQGEGALVVEILKELHDKDENQDEASKASVKIPDNRKQGIKTDQQAPPAPKGAALDLRKVDLQKTPEQAKSCLEMLIALLGSCLNVGVEEVLGLLTNQNKYLIHWIVKGMEGEFSGVVLLYSLLIKHKAKLQALMREDKKDSESCLYALKWGLASQSQEVAGLAIKLIAAMENIYDWLVSDTGKGAATLLLGLKRHPGLVQQFWELLTLLLHNH